MVHQLGRTPGAAWVLTQPRGERLVGEVVRQARGVREQLARRCARKSIEGGPAVEQLGGELAGEWLVECQAPLVGERDGHRGGHALGDARRAESVVRPEGTAAPAGQVSGRAAPHQAGVGRLDPRQGTRRARRDLCLDGGLQTGGHARIPHRTTRLRGAPSHDKSGRETKGPTASRRLPASPASRSCSRRTKPMRRPPLTVMTGLTVRIAPSSHLLALTARS